MIDFDECIYDVNEQLRRDLLENKLVDNRKHLNFVLFCMIDVKINSTSQFLHWTNQNGTKNGTCHKSSTQSVND